MDGSLSSDQRMALIIMTALTDAPTLTAAETAILDWCDEALRFQDTLRYERDTMKVQPDMQSLVCFLILRSFEFIKESQDAILTANHEAPTADANPDVPTVRQARSD